jgi:hypothetical protein
MTRQHQWAYSLSKRFIESIFERECFLESHLSIVPGERRDFFRERNEDHFLSPLEIWIDDAVQVTGKGRERRNRRRKTQSHPSRNVVKKVVTNPGE